MATAPPGSYDEALARGRQIYRPTKIGRPGRGWAYWPLFVLAQALRLRWRIRATGAAQIAPGPAILVGNHLSLMDPIVVGVAHRFRLTFFTKVEVFRAPGAVFFRMTGQIPLVRGDEESTNWALAMSSYALAEGNKLALYPEGTRSPDGRSLHRLHRRILVPVLQANPGIPVHAMTVAYPGTRRGRRTVDVRFSAPLDIDVTAMSSNAITDAVRDALLDLGGMPYTHAFGRELKSAGPPTQ